MEQEVFIFLQKSAAPTHVTYFFRVLFVRADPHGGGGGVSHCYEHNLLCANLATKHLSGVANSKAESAILLALKGCNHIILKI
jgi:hypothetical protein